jgi:hypothetical protein
MSSRCNESLITPWEGPVSAIKKTLIKGSLVFGFCLLGFWQPAQAAAPSLAGGTVNGTAGNLVSLPIIFNRGTAAISGIQFNLTLPAGLTAGSITPGDVLSSAGKTANGNVKGNVWTIIVFGLDQKTLDKGTLLTAQVRIAPGTADGALKIPFSGVVYTDPLGKTIKPGKITAGTVTVGAPKS